MTRASTTTRLAHWSVRLVLAAGIASVAAGALASVWFPEMPEVEPDPCTDPPCLSLDLGENPALLLPFLAHFVLLGLALLLGALALLLALPGARRRQGRRLLRAGTVAAVGPVLVLVGGEVLPHLLNPCALPDLAEFAPPDFCVRSPEGVDVADDWHLLYHALVGFLPLSLVVVGWWRRWTRRAAD